MDHPEKPKKFECPACGKDCTKLFAWGKDGRKVCYSCQQKDAKETEAQRRAFKEEGERAMAAEREAKKAEALKERPGRVELGHWVENAEAEGVKKQFMTKVTAVPASSITPEPMRWLWAEKVPAGSITWAVGKPGNAKSLFATDLAARVSSGRDFPDGAANINGPPKVLMYAGEDDRKRTVIPRLIAAGANLDNVQLLDNSSFEVYDNEWNRIDRRSIDLSQDCKVISELVKQYPDIALLIIDPITGVFGSKNTNHDKDMRPVMNELKDMLELRGLTIVGVAHTNKRGDASAIDQIQGCSSISGAARGAWLFTRDPESDDDHAHVMTNIKVNLAEKKDGLRLLTKAVEVEGAGKHPMIVWGDGTKMTADEANQALKEKRESKNTKRDAVKVAILAMLGEKPLLSKDVYTALEKQGHSSETIKRAAGELTDEKQIYRKQKGGRWYMVLAEHLFEFEGEPELAPEQVMSVGVGEAL